MSMLGWIWMRGVGGALMWWLDMCHGADPRAHVCRNSGQPDKNWQTCITAGLQPFNAARSQWMHGPPAPVPELKCQLVPLLSQWQRQLCWSGSGINEVSWRSSRVCSLENILRIWIEKQLDWESAAGRRLTADEKVQKKKIGEAPDGTTKPPGQGLHPTPWWTLSRGVTAVQPICYIPLLYTPLLTFLFLSLFHKIASEAVYGRIKEIVACSTACGCELSCHILCAICQMLVPLEAFRKRPR